MTYFECFSEDEELKSLGFKITTVIMDELVWECDPGNEIKCKERIVAVIEEYWKREDPTNGKCQNFVKWGI